MLAGFYGQGQHSRAKAFEAAERALVLVGLPIDRATTVDGLGARRAHVVVREGVADRRVLVHQAGVVVEEATLARAQGLTDECV